MTRDEIIKMAQEAVKKHGHEIKYTDENVELLGSFAELVAAKEREACAMVCDEVLNQDGNWSPTGHRFAKAIRSRSNT